MDDRTLQLLNRARDDDRDALGILFERTREPLRRALRRMLGDDYRAHVADSEDAAQEAILAVLSDLQSFEYRGRGSFLAWLLKRSEHELLNRIRSSRRQKRYPGQGRLGSLEELNDDPAVDQSVGGAVHEQEVRDLIRRTIDELPERERDVILLRQYFDLDTAAICAELDLPSPSAARNLYARAQARLAMILKRRGHDGDVL